MERDFAEGERVGPDLKRDKGEPLLNPSVRPSVRIGIEARILMHAANLPGIPWSRGEKEHDVVVGEGGSWDAPDYFRLGPSYGGAGRNHHRRQPVSKLHDSQRHARRHRRFLFSELPRKKFTLHHHSGKRRVAKATVVITWISFLLWGRGKKKVLSAPRKSERGWRYLLRSRIKSFLRTAGRKRKETREPKKRRFTRFRIGVHSIFKRL